MVPNPDRHPVWTRYAVAVLSVAIAAGVRWILLGVLGMRAPFLTFFPAVMVAALGGGLSGGLAATGLSTLVAGFCWMAPAGTLAFRDPVDVALLAVFATTGVMISGVTAAMQRARSRASDAQEMLQYRLLAEHSRDVILYMRRDSGRILEANAAATAVYGYTREELQGLSIHDLRTAVDSGCTESQMAEADAGGILFETEHRRKDGSTFPVEVSSQGATIGGARTLISVIRDITERKLAEGERQRLVSELADRAGELQAVLDTAPVAVWLARDPECRRITGNAFADRVVMQAERGGNVSASAPAADQSATYKVFRGGRELQPEELPNQVAAATAQPVPAGEYELVFRDGRSVHVLLAAVPLMDGNGRVRGSIAAGLDITRRTQAERSLRESESILRGFFDSPGSMRGIVELADGVIYHVSCNEAAAEMYGVDRESVRGLTGSLTGAPEETLRTWVALYEESLRTGKPVSMEYGRRDAAGRDRWLLATAGYVGIGPAGKPRFAYTILDLTERKRAEEALQEQRQWLKVTLNSIGDGVLATDAGGAITFLNPVASRMTGWTEEEALGRAAREVLRVVHERTGEGADDVTARVLRDGLSISMPEHAVLLARDGREIPIEDSAAPIKDEAGEVHGVVLVFHDVTEERRAREALRESEAQFRALANAIPQLCWMASAGGRAFWYNQRWFEYTGTTAEQMEGRGWMSVHDPEALPEIVERWKACVASGEVFDRVISLRGADGAFRPFLTRVVPVRGLDGKAAQWFGTATDIDDQRKAEQAIRESEFRLRTLGDNLPEGAIYRYVHDPGGNPRMEFVSAGIERLTGIPAAEFMSDNVIATREFLPEDAERMQAAIVRSREQLTQFEVEVRHRHLATGEARWSLLRSTPSRRPDGSTVWDGIEVDITERKRAEEELRKQEEALRESESRYRRLADLAPGALLVQQDGRIVYSNEAAARLYGAPNDKLLGTPMFDRVHPDDVPMVRERIAEAQTGTRLPLKEARHLRLDGSEVSVETTAGPIEWQGRPAMLVFVQDITDRKLAEARLRDTQKLESLGLLAGGVAHDFNNLLVGVIGNASLSRDMLEPDHPAIELIDGVLKAGEQAAHLTRQMLAYSGRGRFLVEPLDVSTLIPEMSGLVRPSISKKIELRFDLAGNLPPIEADRGQIQQVFMNLVLNAAEAIGNQPGSITVWTGLEEVDETRRRQRPELAGLASGSYVRLAIEDTGCGMDEATRAKIFDPFFSTKFVGRGLGLAAVAGIVRGHQGAIAVASVPGRGSCFEVFFPAGVRAAGCRAAGPDLSLRGAGTILVVDDEPLVREMVRRALERHGYQILLADGGPSAIDVCRRHPGEIALAILDLSMPHMSGEEAFPELRKVRPDMKVLVTSGYGESETMNMFAGRRVSGFIQKPYSAQAIAEKVKLCLG